MHELYTVLAEYYDVIYRKRKELVKKEIDFVEDLFRREAEREVKRILDLACGTGTPTLELAKRGYEVIGLDLHEEMLQVARRKSEKEGIKVEFIQGNALEIDFEEEFDAITMFFSSITYFDDYSIQQLFNSIKQALKPGGIFVADFPCWFYSGKDYPIIWDEQNGDERLVITDWREIEPAFQKMRFKRLVQIIKPDGSVKTFMVDDELNIYTPREMRLLAEKHFRKVKIYGNLHELKPNDRRYWLVAIK
ncbi:class I SAM-dependent methyltransferase [Pyrococcus abyssi]|uniref:Menaquinone biosynthesis methlytransferase related n=1 Tax=Pyrococcus abyssi (strain GE5 / Orsay) TaxID=272844 RepID=Q9V097_PYRAB|nr:class I SAM-dependent methyltransferase [Pyrococcus abyssi]CAB49808.1 SAM-dependent methyltransferase [Pyrococcus abyssi GE5]CCE70301.1 TPA: menaquinone biosynthesis methlytransferase related [Pyrococcus abyssi GE5]